MSGVDVGRFGIWTSALDRQPATIVRQAVAEIERLGFGALWVGEAARREVFANASLLLSATQQLVADYATHVAALLINPDAKRLRRRNAEHLTGGHPDLWAWLGRSTQGRLADLSRSHAWPLITWAWVNGRLPIDLDLMLAARAP